MVVLRFDHNSNSNNNYYIIVIQTLTICIISFDARHRINLSQFSQAHKCQRGAQLKLRFGVEKNKCKFGLNANAEWPLGQSDQKRTYLSKIENVGTTIQCTTPPHVRKRIEFHERIEFYTFDTISRLIDGTQQDNDMKQRKIETKRERKA